MSVLDRRGFLVLGSAAAVSPAVAAPIGALGVDGAQFGLRPGSADDQSRAFQRAIEETARNRAPLAIAPGSYRVGNLRLPANAHIVGVRGATKLLFGDGPSLIVGDRRRACHAVTGSCSTACGRPAARTARPRPHRQHPAAQDHRLRDLNAGGTAIACTAVDGEIADTLVSDSADVGDPFLRRPRAV